MTKPVNTRMAVLKIAVTTQSKIVLKEIMLQTMKVVSIFRCNSNDSNVLAHSPSYKIHALDHVVVQIVAWSRNARLSHYKEHTMYQQ